MRTGVTGTGPYGRVCYEDIKRAAELLRVTITGRELYPGDLYLAGRNNDVHLLTCRRVNVETGWVIPVEPAYAYDICECHAVEDNT
jgi:hypothetical protein